MAIASHIGPATHGENPWSYNVSQDGTITITERKLGDLATVLAWVQSFAIGTVYQLIASADCPFGGYYLATGAQADVSVSGMASGVRTYTVPKGDTTALSSVTPTELARTEVIDFATLEKPVQESAWWRAISNPVAVEYRQEMLEAMKRVQLYIDAPTPDKATEALNEFVHRDEEMKMANLLMSGIEAYLYPAPTASLSYESKTKPADFGTGVGKLFATPGTTNIGAPAGFDWLCNGDRLEWSRGSGLFSRTQSWIGADYWDADLYARGDQGN